MQPGLLMPAPMEFADRARSLDSIPSYRAWRAGHNARKVVVRGCVVKWFVFTQAPHVRQIDGHMGRETLMPGAFSDYLACGRSVRALIDHSALLDLGGTDDGSLRLVEDADGLHYTLTIPETRTGRILQAAIDKGRFRGMSFGYGPAGPLGAVWTNGQRTLWKANLSEISFLIRQEPAYRTGTAILDVPVCVLRERLDALVEL